MMLRRVLCLLSAAGLLALLLLTLTGLFFRPLVAYTMRPAAAFDSATVPAAPNYADAAAWSALPGREDAADVALPDLPPVAERSAPADVFYVHPTTYIGSGWNGPIDDARLNMDTDRVATRIQASAFNGCCAIYAPRYRQANGTAFIRPLPGREQALELAYSDVAAAFHHYLQHQSQGRPFILAGHSQGAMLAYRLLVQEISRQPLRGRLVAAYLVGGAISLDDLARDAPDVPVCAAPQQTGCVVGWNARGPRYVPGGFEMTPPRPSAAERGGTAVRLCVNPLTFLADGAAAPAEANQGALFWDAPAPAVLPRFASAACKDGTLVVFEVGKPPRDFMSRLLDYALGPENYHPIEYQLFYVNLRNNAKLRVESYRRQRQTGAFPQ